MLKVKGSSFRALDISNTSFSGVSLLDFPFQVMTNLEEFKMCDCFNANEVQNAQQFISNLFESRNRLKIVDLSGNNFGPSMRLMNHLLTVLPLQLEALSLSQVHFPDRSVNHLQGALQKLTYLKKLDISGNESISAQAMR